MPKGNHSLLNRTSETKSSYLKEKTGKKHALVLGTQHLTQSKEPQINKHFATSVENWQSRAPELIHLLPRMVKPLPMAYILRQALLRHFTKVTTSRQDQVLAPQHKMIQPRLKEDGKNILLKVRISLVLMLRFLHPHCKHFQCHDKGSFHT